MGEQHAIDWRVIGRRLVADATVDAIADPMSGRDIRRLWTRSCPSITGSPRCSSLPFSETSMVKPVPAEQSAGMSDAVKTPQSIPGDIALMQRESDMVMATVTSLADDELSKPSKCAGWTRAQVIAHLARGADAMTNLATWAVTGQETPAYESREKRDADVEAAVGRSAAELAADLEQANARLLAAFQALKDGVRVETLPTLFSGEISAFSLPSRRTTELIIHHDDLDTTWEWHEADPAAILDAIEVCVRRLQGNPDSPGLQIIAGEGEQWTVGDGAYRIEGYYEELLPFLARGQVEEGLQYAGELPKLPPW